MITDARFTTIACALDVKVGIQNKSPIDIICCTGDTKMNLDDFEGKMRAALRAQGIEDSRVRIQAGKSMTISSAGAGAQQIYDTWRIMPTGTQGFKVSGEKLVAPNAENWSGFVDPTSYQAAGRLKMTMNFAYTDIPQAMGVMFKVSPESLPVTESTKLDFYVVILSSGWRKDPVGRLGLFKIRGYNAFDSDHLNKGGPVPWFWRTYNAQSPAGTFLSSNPNWLLHSWTIKGSPTFQMYDSMCTWLADKELSNYSVLEHTDQLTNMSVEYNKGHIEVYFEGEKCIDYQDSDPIDTGGWGFGNNSVSSSYYRDIVIESGTTLDLIEVVRSPDYQNLSNRFIVDVCDTPREDFAQLNQVGELAERITADNAYYLGWGKQASKSSMQSFIERCGGQGRYFTSTADDIYEQTAIYIEPIVNKRMPESGRQDLLRDHSYAFDITK